jgi:hypothetical protein
MDWPKAGLSWTEEEAGQKSQIAINTQPKSTGSCVDCD